MTNVDFYQRHLDRVSRSFAFCIARLESPLRRWVSLTYLICRVLDTVEDARWRKKTKQLESFIAFESLIDSKKDSEFVKNWVQALPEDLPEGERLLVEDSPLLFSDLHEAPKGIREVIQTLAGSMARGMRHFVARSDNGHMRLRSLQEVNQYCFFVAGIVGEALSRLLASVDHRLQITRRTLINAHHFGLFLQKVNLLKDQAVDEVEGRFLVTSRDDVYASLKKNAEGAMTYIESIPVSHRGYRYFCATSLFLGMATLPRLRQGSGAKISRLEAMKLFNKLEEVVDHPEKLKSLFSQLMDRAEFTKDSFSPPSSNHGDLTWIKSAYCGGLDGVDFLELQMA